jgi:hypothetical protein
VAYFKVLLQQSYEENAENHEYPVRSMDASVDSQTKNGSDVRS